MSCYCIISYFTKHDIDACLLNIFVNDFISYCESDEIKCKRCNRFGHEITDCYSRRHENGKELIKYKNKCYKCYRENHITENCDANIDIYGNYLT